MLDDDLSSLITSYRRLAAAVDAYGRQVADLSAAARALAADDGSPASLDLIRRIDSGEFRWGFHVAGDDSGEDSVIGGGIP